MSHVVLIIKIESLLLFGWFLSPLLLTKMAQKQMIINRFVCFFGKAIDLDTI